MPLWERLASNIESEQLSEWSLPLRCAKAMPRPTLYDSNTLQAQIASVFGRTNVRP